MPNAPVPNTPRPTRRTVLATLAAVPLLAACSPGPGRAAPKLALDQVWQRSIEFDAARGVDYLTDRLTLLGDTVMFAEGVDVEPSKITALDAATGAERWSITVGQEITAPTVGRVRLSGCGRGAYGSFDKIFRNPVLRSVGELLPVSYVSGTGARAACGVIGVSLRTGEPAWGFAATTEASASRAVITAVSDTVVIIAVTPAVGPDWPEVGAPLTLIAVDAATGRRLWSEPDLLGLAADGESVVAAKRQGSDSRDVWTPLVLDARTGKPRWTGQQELDHPSTLYATAADHTVIWPGSPTMGDYQIVQLSTGHQLDFTELHPPTPVATEPPLLAWDTSDEFWNPWSSGFYTQLLPEGTAHHGRGRPGGIDFAPVTGVGPHLWGQLTGTQATWQRDAHFIGVAALDRTGTPRSPSLKGLLAGVNDHWLLLVASDGFAGYRITPA